MFRNLLPLALGLVVLGGLTGCKKGEMTDDVAVRIGDEDVSRVDFDRQIKSVPAFMLADSAQGRQVRQQILDNIVMSKLLVAEAKKQGFKIDTAVVAQQMTMLRAQVGSDTAFTARLKEINMTEAELREQISESTLAQQLIEQRLKTRFSEVPAEKRDSALNAPTVHARHILWRIEEGTAEAEVQRAQREAEQVRQLAIKPNADFEALARQYSQDPGSKDEGGDLGFFGRGMMVPEFEQRAFALKSGEVSEVFRSPFGIHILKVEAFRPVRASAPDSARVMQELQGTYGQQRFMGYIDSLKTAYKVVLNDRFLAGTFTPADTTQKR